MACVKLLNLDFNKLRRILSEESGAQISIEAGLREMDVLTKLILNFVHDVLLPLEKSGSRAFLRPNTGGTDKIMPLSIVFPTQEYLREADAARNEGECREVAISASVENALRARFPDLECALKLGYEWLLLLCLQGCMDENGDWGLLTVERGQQLEPANSDVSLVVMKLVKNSRAEYAVDPALPLPGKRRQQV